MATDSKKAPLLPAYLIVGEDELKRETVLKRLHKRLEELGDLSLNSEHFSGDTATGEEIVTACNTIPFASPVRLVEVAHVEKLRKHDTEMLIDYLKAPSESTVLCLIALKLPKGTALYKAVQSIGKQAIIDCAPMDRRQLLQALQSMAIGHGASITPSAASTLMDLVGTNTVALDSELKKLALAHRGDDPINDGEVLALVARTTEVKPWEFVDAFSARNLSRCFSMHEHMEKVSSYALLGICVTRIRELLSTKAIVARGQADQIPTVLGQPAWRVKNHRTWSQRFTSEELIQGLVSARDTEQAMKTGADPDTAFMDWVVSVTKH